MSNNDASHGPDQLHARPTHAHAETSDETRALAGFDSMAEQYDAPRFHDPADPAAIDALFSERAGQPAQPDAPSARIVRLESLLSLLDSPFAGEGDGAHNDNARDDLLRSATIARILRSSAGSDHHSREANTSEVELSEADRRAVDAMIACGWDDTSAPAELRDRCKKLAALAGLLEPVSADSPASMTAPTNSGQAGGNSRVLRSLRDRTMLLIDQAENRSGELLRADVELDGRIFRPMAGRWRDLMAIAATLLIAVGVGWPMLAGLQDQHGRIACRANLMTAGFGFGHYANDFRDRLPLASASVPGLPWWQVGDPERSNSANLFTLVSRSYVGAEALTDPAYADASAPSKLLPGALDWPELRGVSYSFQNLFAAERPAWNGPARVAILSCRSPVVVRSVTGDRMTISVLMGNSLTHGLSRSREGAAGGAGQNVLFNDGAVKWLDNPVLENGDHLWLPAWVERALDDLVRFGQRPPIRGSESPESATDTFLAP